MEISARSYLTAGVALTTATAITFTPAVLPRTPEALHLPTVASPAVTLAVSPADIEAFVAELQAALDGATDSAAAAAGAPGQSLIGVVNTIVASINTGFGGLIDATDDPTLVASLTILQTLSADAFAKLAENLGRINPVITSTTAEVGELLSTALTGAFEDVAVAVVNALNDPLSLSSYTGLVDAAFDGGRLLAGNGIAAVHSLTDGAFEITGIAIDEVTFQLNNAVGGLSTLATQLGDATGSAVVAAVVDAVRSLAVAPAVAAFNAGSAALKTVLTTADAGFDAVLDGAEDIVNPPGLTSGTTENADDTTVDATAVEADARAKTVAWSPRVRATAPDTVLTRVRDALQPVEPQVDTPPAGVTPAADAVTSRKFVRLSVPRDVTAGVDAEDTSEKDESGTDDAAATTGSSDTRDSVTTRPDRPRHASTRGPRSARTDSGESRDSTADAPKGPKHRRLGERRSATKDSGASSAKSDAGSSGADGSSSDAS